MRKLIPLLCLFIFCSCTNSADKTASNEKTNSATSRQGKFDWLLGDWKRSNDAENRQTFEYWERDGKGEYRGTGITLEGRDTVFQEQMALQRIEGFWHLVVSGVNEQPTHFKFSKHGEFSFQCENPENDFPKTIIYWAEDGKLNAMISDGENKVAFEFEKNKG